MRVVPAVDELEDRQLRLGMRAKGVALDQLAFYGGEEVLAHRVVEAVAHRSRGHIADQRSRSASLRRMILPVEVFGRSSTNWTARGTL